MAGHIIPQPNGKYRLIVSDGVSHDGKRQRHSRTINASSMKQAEKQLALFVAEVESGQEIEIATCTKHWPAMAPGGTVNPAAIPLPPSITIIPCSMAFLIER